MKVGLLNGKLLEDRSVSTNKLQSGSVTTDKIQSGAINVSKLGNDVLELINSGSSENIISSRTIKQTSKTGKEISEILPFQIYLKEGSDIYLIHEIDSDLLLIDSTPDVETYNQCRILYINNTENKLILTIPESDNLISNSQKFAVRPKSVLQLQIFGYGLKRFISALL